MVRSYWKGALVLTLAVGGVIRAQQTAVPPLVATAPNGIVTVQQMGKPAQKCRILESWPTGDGKTAVKVQSLETGEVSTIIEGPSAGLMKTPGKAPVSPYGVIQTNATQPAPPPLVQGERLLPMPVGPGAPPTTVAAPATAPGSCGCTGGACGDGSEYRTVQEDGRAPMRCRVLRRWRLADGHQACQCQCAENGELMTIVETGPATPVADAPPGTRVTAIATRIFHWGRNRTPPTGCPMPPDVAPEAVASAPVIVSEIPIEGPIVRERTPFGMRLKERVQHLFAGRPAPIPSMPEEPAMRFEPPRAQPVLVQAPPRGNWRDSWDGMNSTAVANSAPPVRAPLAQPPVVVQLPTPATPTPLPTVIAQLPPAPAMPSNWRESWGKAKAPKPSDSQLPLPAPVTAQLPSAGPTLPTPPVSSTVTQQRSDPLADPGSFTSRKVEDKMPALKSDASQAYGKAFTPPVPPAPPTQTAAAKPQPAPTTPLPEVKMPPGAQSVLAASNGIETPVRFVPMPIVTQPERRQPPVPPVPQIPQAPQPNDKFVNAFSPPVPPGGQPNGGQGMMPMNAQGMMPPMMTGPGGVVPGYAPMSPYAAMSPGYPPMVGQTAMAPGYPPAMYQARSPNGAYPPMMMAQRAAGYGYPSMAQGYQGAYPTMQPMMAPQYPYNPMGQTMPMAPGYGPTRAYQGPMPPNPFGQAAPMPVGFGTSPAVAQVANWQAAPGFNAAMDRHALPSGMSAVQSAASDAIAEMITVLKTSSYPSQKQWAANNLANFDWHSYPQVVQALLTAAKDDPAPSVRSGCVYSLARMRVTAEPVRAVLLHLKSDSDPRVRDEAEQALARLGLAPRPGMEQSAVQPVGGIVPR